MGEKLLLEEPDLLASETGSGRHLGLIHFFRHGLGGVAAQRISRRDDVCLITISIKGVVARQAGDLRLAGRISAVPVVLVVHDDRTRGLSQLLALLVMFVCLDETDHRVTALGPSTVDSHGAGDDHSAPPSIM